MNTRIEQLRQALGLSGEKFGEPLGVNRSAVSRWESGKNNITDQMIKLICLTYKVNENWLRTGEGEMFIQTDDSFLASLKEEYNLTDLQVSIVKSYLELSDTEKQSIDKFISSCAKNTDD